jgi:ApaG protein
MPTAITKDIRIEVETQYQQQKPAEADETNMFLYRISIENKGDHTIKLLRRHWHVVDVNYPNVEIEGEGVIGQQPVLEPGEKYEYVSGCTLHSDIGKMYGTYLMERQIDGKKFKVKIPEFTLVATPRLN